MDFSRLIYSEEGKDGPIGRKSHGYDFLGFEGNDPNRLFGERTHDHRAEDIIVETEAYFNEFDKSYFLAVSKK